jgi:mercuric ion transport protein
MQSTVEDSVASQACSRKVSNERKLAKWATAGGIVAAVGVCAACCLLPFLLVGVGVAGAWVATLDALAPYKWYFVVATAGLLGYGFYVAYRKPKPGCAAGSSCPSCGAGTAVKVGLWGGVVLAFSGIAFESLERFLG